MRAHARRRGLALAAVVLLAACGGGQRSGNGQIAFMSEQADGDFDIWLMHPDGTGKHRLTADTEEKGLQSWSPDGRSIVFVREPVAGKADVYVSRPDGSGEHRLTRWGDVLRAGWSPDGKQLGVVRAGSGHTLYVIGADGSGARRLVSRFRVETPPTWSPDGSTIAVVRGPKVDSSTIELVDVRRGGATSLAAGESPSWSPDGRRIAFEQDGHLMVVDADGGHATRILRKYLGFSPRWSPDGKRIAFETVGNFFALLDRNLVAIAVVDVDGSHRRVVARDAVDVPPVWSPDGTKVLYSKTPYKGNADIYVADLGGGKSVRLTDAPGVEVLPVWQAVRG